ncbi:MAG: amino acid permease [Gammaproteobacteria bacterium]|nr:amino acid permease [Gammaproteobacteria bacterium]MDG1952556.1 amino acid permease [Gammaproteobacteria bacterium]MDG2118320.1 amino acid permease [Gammaproteobacteria bacterium]|tara:strand:+ start:703 stop:2022 length:1320 start_codon:yes stop_codon:yes gene_type:complete
MEQRKFRYTTVTAVVVANMVGTGVFTSLGFQLVDLRSGFTLLMLWAVGGIAALCGAMTYAELGAAMPRSGGEYNFLTRIYHPAAGFVSGWVSATIGFAGPVALASLTFSAYAFSIFPGEQGDFSQQLLASALVISLTLLHATNRDNSGNVQIVFTILKIAIIIFFCAGALAFVDEPQLISFAPGAEGFSSLGSGEFAVALIYVSYAYTGWNAATYLSSELENPQRTLPLILISGTLIVMVLYIALNFVFLYTTPMDAMEGQLEVGFIAAEASFGAVGGQFMGLILALLLISTVSAMTLAGPRVIQVIGEDFPPLSIVGKTNRSGVPANAIFLQSTIALLFIFSSTFDSILVFSGFTLALNSFATVLGIFVLRWRQPDLPRPYRTLLYPIPPLIYLALTGWTLWFVLMNRPVEGLFGLGIIGTGLIVYFISSFLSNEKTT